MKKHFILLILALLLLCSGCGGGDVTSSQSDPVSSSAVTSEVTSEIQTPTPDRVYDPPTTITGAALDTTPANPLLYSQIGYAEEMLLREDANILQYFDFNTQQWYAVCSKANCSHSDEKCNGWLGDGSYGGFMAIGESIYYLAVDASGTRQTCVKFNISDQSRQTLCDVDCGVSAVYILHSNACTYIDHRFSFLQTLEVQEGDELVRKTFLVCIDLQQGKQLFAEELPGADDGFNMVGSCEDRYVFEQHNYQEELLTEEEFYAQYGTGADYYSYQLTQSMQEALTVYDASTGEWSCVYRFADQELVDYSYGWSMYGPYFIFSEGDTFWAISIDTGEKTQLIHFETGSASIESILGNELFFLTVNGEEMDKYVYDLSTGTGRWLGQHNGEGHPFYMTKDYFFWEYLRYISKEDYYAGNWSGWMELPLWSWYPTE